MRSNFLSYNEPEVNVPHALDFIMPDDIYAVAADNNYADTVWFIEVIAEEKAEQDVLDDFGHKVAKGVKFLSGHFLELAHSVKDGIYYRLNKKKETFQLCTLSFNLL